MEVKWTISGSKGFMAEGVFSCLLVAEISSILMRKLDKLPDEIENQSFMDWKKISLEIIRIL